MSSPKRPRHGVAPPRAAKPEPAETDGRRLRRVATEAKLLEAVDAILLEGGVAALGVNAIAARAGVEKVLVYRYFGGLEGLVTAWAERSDFWPTLDELVGPRREVLHGDPATVGGRVLARYAAALRRRPVTLDLLAWECAHRDGLTAALERVREERSEELAAVLVEEGVPLGGSAGEIGAILAAAINYLAVRGRSIETFGGLRVRTAKDWARIEELMTTVFVALARGDRAAR